MATLPKALGSASPRISSLCAPPSAVSKPLGARATRIALGARTAIRRVGARAGFRGEIAAGRDSRQVPRGKLGGKSRRARKRPSGHARWIVETTSRTRASKASSTRTPDAPLGNWARWPQVLQSRTRNSLQDQWPTRSLKQTRRELVASRRQLLLSRINGRRRRAPIRKVRTWTSRYTHRTLTEPATTGST